MRHEKEVEKRNAIVKRFVNLIQAKVIKKIKYTKNL